MTLDISGKGPRSFVVQCKEFFGMKPGQQLKEFNDELKALTPQDRIDLSTMLTDAGYPVIVA